MPIQFLDGKILFVDGAIAMDEACCCGCHCSSELPDVLLVHYPYVPWSENDPHANEPIWTVQVRRPIPTHRDPPFDFESLQPPDHMGDCCWYGEAVAQWNDPDQTCGVVWLYLDPANCRWSVSYASGTRSGTTPFGEYTNYVLSNWGGDPNAVVVVAKP